MNSRLNKSRKSYLDIIAKEDTKIYGLPNIKSTNTKKYLIFIESKIQKNIYNEKLSPGKYLSLSPISNNKSFKFYSSTPRFKTGIDHKYLSRNFKKTSLNELQKKIINKRISKDKKKPEMN
jgi:hypothetical protein